MAINAAGSYVVAVRPLKRAEWVYCINVPGVKEFVLASGHVVHNSEDHAADALRYLAVHVFSPHARKEAKAGGTAAKIIESSLKGVA